MRARWAHHILDRADREDDVAVAHLGRIVHQQDGHLGTDAKATAHLGVESDFDIETGTAGGEACHGFGRRLTRRWRTHPWRGPVGFGSLGCKASGPPAAASTMSEAHQVATQQLGCACGFFCQL